MWFINITQHLNVNLHSGHLKIKCDHIVLKLHEIMHNLLLLQVHETCTL